MYWMNTRMWKVWLGIILLLLNAMAVGKPYRRQPHLYVVT